MKRPRKIYVKAARLLDAQKLMCYADGWWQQASNRKGWWFCPEFIGNMNV